jgi:nucleotide-binding universal stress UspA family protein
MVLGSTAYKLVHSTNKPVLVVPTAKQRRRAA